MVLTHDQVFLVDDEPMTPQEMMDFACQYDRRYANDPLKTTSQAASILRRYRYIVADTRDKL